MTPPRPPEGKPFYGDSEAALATKAIYEQGYAQAIEDAMKVATKICDTENGADVQFMIPEAIKALLSRGSR